MLTSPAQGRTKKTSHVKVFVYLGVFAQEKARKIDGALLKKRGKRKKKNFVSNTKKKQIPLIPVPNRAQLAQLMERR